PTYTFPGPSIATPANSILPVEWNGLAHVYVPSGSSRQTNPDPAGVAAARLLVTVAAGLKSAVPLNWPVIAIRPDGSTASAVAELVPPTARAMNRFPVELSFHRYADPPADAVSVAVA